jgi:hypothetical protein
MASAQGRSPKGRHPTIYSLTHRNNATLWVSSRGGRGDRGEMVDGW